MRYGGLLVAGALLFGGYGNAFAIPQEKDESAATTTTQTEELAKELLKAEKLRRAILKAELKKELIEELREEIRREVKHEMGAGAALEEATSSITKFEADFADFLKRYQAASTAEKKEMRSQVPNRNALTKKLEKIAAEYPIAPAGGEAIAYLAGNSRDNADYLDTLFEHHVKRECMHRVTTALMFSRGEDGEDRLRILTKSSHAKVQGMAKFALAQKLGRSKGNEEEVGDLYKEIVSNKAYAKIESRPGSLIVDAAKSAVFEMENLAVGKVAPDIVAKDLDGVEFKLSEYRGKVVFLDFWGNW